MPKLVSVLPSDLSRTRGGAERYAFELHAALARALPDWDARGLVVATEGAAQLVPDGWTAVGGPFARHLSVGDAIGFSTMLAQLARGADVVMCHQWRTRATTAMRAARLVRRRTRFVAMDHGAGTRLGYALSWIPLPGAEIAAHQSEFEAAISPVRGRRHVVARGGVDERRFTPAADGTPATDFLMVGRILPYKGQLRFLECLPDGARARLIGPADSEDASYLAAVRAKAAERGVAIDHDVSDEELVDAYRDARYTVQVPIDLRRYEGAAPPELLGLTMLEAMACGSVPICPDGGASAEFVTAGASGLGYEQDSAEALSRVLRDALAEPGRHAELRDGALAEAARWTWDGAAQTILAALGLGSGH